MKTTREIVFIDPAVADIPALIAGLQPGVVPVLLGGTMPALEEIARALRGRKGLDAIHIIVHGRSGELSFSAGALSLASIDHHADDLAAIGDALGPDGDLLLWSCRAGEGARGRAFVDALSLATGATVAAATGLVGAAALGGTWELEAWTRRAVVRPPLTDAGVAGYAGVLATITSSGPADQIIIYGTYAAGTAAGTYFITANIGGNEEVIGSFTVVSSSAGGTYSVTVSLPAGTYTLNSSGPNGIEIQDASFTTLNGTWTLTGEDTASNGRDRGNRRHRRHRSNRSNRSNWSNRSYWRNW